MKAIIIGGGIGGIAAAIGLHRAGIDAHIYERATALLEIGAGISLWPNAINALNELGLKHELGAHSYSGVSGDVRTSRGRVLSGANSRESSWRYGLTFTVFHRAELLSLLVGAVKPDYIHLDHCCTGFAQDGAAVIAQFSNGCTEQGDVLIGADGLRSAIRSQMFGEKSPRYSGYTAWRAVVEFQPTEVTATEIWGRGRRFGSIPMDGRRVYWYATQNAPEGERDSPAGTKRKLLKLFRGWGFVEGLIEATQESAIIRNDIYDRDPLSRWSDNRVTLLGDAAHPMTPNLGQGGCQAIEDAVVLAACLGTQSRADAALREYERRRIPRTTRIVMASRRIGQLSQWENPILCSVRNALIRATPESVTARQINSVVVYEALAEAEKALLISNDSQPKAASR